MKKFSHTKEVTGIFTGDGDCSRFFTIDGQYLYTAELVMPEDYEDFEERFKGEWYRKHGYPDRHTHMEAPLVRVKVSVEVEVLEDISHARGHKERLNPGFSNNYT